MIEDLKVLLGLPEEIDEELENKLLLILKARGLCKTGKRY